MLFLLGSDLHNGHAPDVQPAFGGIFEQYLGMGLSGVSAYGAGLLSVGYSEVH
jgi:hypothetical protein